MFLVMKKSSVFAALFGILTFHCAVDTQTCEPLNGEDVDCKSIHDCPAALGILNTKILAVVQILRKLQCGFDGLIPRVCCASSSPEINNFPDFNEFGPTVPIIPPATTAVPVQLQETERFDTELLPTLDKCGLDQNSDRIYNGKVTNIDEFPWMALLSYEKGDGTTVFHCGGVLISKRYILTAAHCITIKTTFTTYTVKTVRLGEYNTNTSPDCVTVGGINDCADPHQDINVEEIIKHSGFSFYNINRKDDIALIRLNRDVNFSDFISPICLGNSYLKTNTGDSVTVAGWGRTLVATSSNIKLKLSLPIFDKAECIRIYATLNSPLTENQICAGGEISRDSCNGDSGGPLMQQIGERWYSVGIVSFGYGCGRSGWPGIYTSVEKYGSWIRRNMRA